MFTDNCAVTYLTFFLFQHEIKQWKQKSEKYKRGSRKCLLTLRNMKIFVSVPQTVYFCSLTCVAARDAVLFYSLKFLYFFALSNHNLSVYVSRQAISIFSPLLKPVSFVTSMTIFTAIDLGMLTIRSHTFPFWNGKLGRDGQEKQIFHKENHIFHVTGSIMNMAIM